MCYPFKHKTYIRSIKSTCVKAPTGVTMAIADEKNGSTNKYTGRTQKDTTSRMNTLLSVSLIFVLTLEAALPTTATVDVEVTDNEHSLRKNGRRLQFEWLGGYQPRSLITDHAAIDLDQKVIETLLGLRQLNLAKTIYEEGGHSQAIARIISNQPPEPPAQPVPKGTPVVGTSDEGKVIHGSLSEDLMWDTDNKFVELLVQYTANTDQTNYVGCQVGGLTVASMAYKDGCFAEAGEVQVLGMQRDAPVFRFNYTYNIRQDNINGRTIQRFSTRAQAEMAGCENCPYAEFDKYLKYYGAADYGDKWITAALDGKVTRFDNGNADFSQMERPGRLEAVKIGTKFLNIWMYTIRMLEYSLDRCEAPCGRTCDVSPIRSWDQAFAFYAGSLEGVSGSPEGLLTFRLADDMCEKFKACGNDASLRTGTSYANNMIVEEFYAGQALIAKRNCDETRVHKENIIKLMRVPLIQATLYSAYTRNYNKAGTDEDITVDQVIGASYAATVLPLVHSCNPKDAKIIYDNMQITDSPKDAVVNFRAVKSAFERNYECMEVTCESVGGVWEGSEYGTYAAPCRSVGPEESSTPGGTIFLIMVGIVTIILTVLFVLHRRYNGTDPDFRNTEPTHHPDILGGRSFD